MKSVSGKTLCKILERRGWVKKRVKGSHHIYFNPTAQKIITVPVHSNRDIPVGTLRSLMRDADLTEADLT
jgi:predicted RNA binding protein YcfA (HicA-like mRNA interferase family)